MGFIYILRNPAHKSGIYKVGLTKNPVEERAKGLSSQTSSPLPFEIIYRKKVPNRKLEECETNAHNRLKKYRINKKREFFRCSLWKIKNAVDHQGVPNYHKIILRRLFALLITISPLLILIGFCKYKELRIEKEILKLIEPLESKIKMILF
jgi:hypothetical protein